MEGGWQEAGGRERGCNIGGGRQEKGCLNGGSKSGGPLEGGYMGGAGRGRGEGGLNGGTLDGGMDEWTEGGRRVCMETGEGHGGGREAERGDAAWGSGWKRRDRGIEGHFMEGWMVGKG